jgi:hypothetical protein
MGVVHGLWVFAGGVGEVHLSVLRFFTIFAARNIYICKAYDFS